jgi:small subunit ribosomal protein S18
MAKEQRRPKTKPQQFKKRKKKPCVFCVDKIILDYKDTGFVRRFVTDRGKIAPRRLSSCCALHQRMIAMAIKRARQIGTIPYVVD